MTADQPLSVLSFIAAPALLTNASSLMVLSTSNRFARAVDRMRANAGILREGKGEQAYLASINAGRLIAERRAEVLLTALRAFYLGVGMMAFSTVVGLVAGFVSVMGYVDFVEPLSVAAIALTGLGVLADGTGATFLIREMSITLKGLRVEMGAVVWPR